MPETKKGGHKNGPSAPAPLPRSHAFLFPALTLSPAVVNTRPTAGMAGTTPASRKGTATGVMTLCLRSLRNSLFDSQRVGHLGGQGLALSLLLLLWTLCDGKDTEMWGKWRGQHTGHATSLPTEPFLLWRLRHWSSPLHLCGVHFSSLRETPQGRFSFHSSGPFRGAWVHSASLLPPYI